MIKNFYKSKFIVFEGIDGSGKSSQYTLFRDFLKSKHKKVSAVYPKEPDIKRPIGNEIYKILKGEHSGYKLKNTHPYRIQVLYIEDRISNYRKNIIPALKSGKNVIQDRGAVSSICYGADSMKEFDSLTDLHNRIFSAAQVPFIWPDLILIYDIPADLAIERMRKGGKKLDGFEIKEKLVRVRKNYLAFARMYPNCIVINGKLLPEKVFEFTLNHIMPIMPILS